MKAKCIIAIVALTPLPGSEGSSPKSVLYQTIIPAQVRDAGGGVEGGSVCQIKDTSGGSCEDKNAGKM